MNILIVGGTRFQGIYLVDELIRSGNEVTVFHRGTHPLKRTDVKEILGDRDNLLDLKKLNLVEYDWVIDSCGYRPLQIRNLINNLKGSSYKLCFISSVYVYEKSESEISEESELKKPSSDEDQLTEETYGNFKVSCENVIKEELDQRYLILRPSVISGPGDHSFRLLFWIELTEQLQAKLEIKEMNRSIQVVDVRDLTKFTSDCLNNHLVGVFNVASKPFLLSEMLNDIGEKFNKIKRITWEGIGGLELSPKDLPYCYPNESEDYDFKKALKLGLKSRSLKEMIADSRSFSSDLEMNETLKKSKAKLASL